MRTRIVLSLDKRRKECSLECCYYPFFTDTLFINVYEIILLDTLDLKRYSPRKPVCNFLNVHVASIELFHETKLCYLSGTGGSGDENDNDTTAWLAYLGFATLCSCELDRDSVTVTSCLTLHYGIVVITRD